VARRRWRRVVGAALTIAVTTVAAGCANSQEGPVEEIARDFYRALEADDGAAACALLAERTRSELEKAAQKPCDQAIVDEDLPTVLGLGKVRSFGVAAQVRFDEETTFLSRFRDGWRVVAAGCARLPEGRYDCQVEAG
jgi:hypothetical protein